MKAWICRRRSMNGITPPGSIEIRMEEAAGAIDRNAMERNVFSERYLIRRPVLDALTGTRQYAGFPD